MYSVNINLAQGDLNEPMKSHSELLVLFPINDGGNYLNFPSNSYTYTFS